MTAEPRQLLREGLWIAVGNVVAALATLIGTRLITELAEPAMFGRFVLLNGVLALLQGLLFQPMGQAVFRFYAEFDARGEAESLHAHLRNRFRRRAILAAAALLCVGALDQTSLRVLSLSAWAALALAVLPEAWKTSEVVMRNAARRQRSFAMLLAADSVARPTGALLAAWGFGVSVEALLFGQAIGAAAVLAALTRTSRRHEHGANVEIQHARSVSLGFEELHRFAAPLLWLPVVGWLGAMGDRYIVAGLLGVSQAGIYAAAYGIASRPLLLIGSIADSTFRQPYYEAVASSASSGARRQVLRWLAFNISLGILALTLIWSFADFLTALLVAGAYAQAAALLPWIAGGYVLLIMAQVLVRVAYAHRRTQAAVWVEVASAMAALACAAIGAQAFGLAGVAAAVPAYCAIQLALTAYVARGARQNLAEEA